MRKLYALAVFVLFSATNIYAQDITVTGKVTDSEDGTELPGVSILIKGTAKGTITDFEGNYSIDAPSEATLVFNYLGYEPQEISVSNQTSIDVQMSTETEVLQEVVVVGYGVVEKGDVTGVIKKVDEEQFNKGMISTPQNLISGKVAGVQVSGSGEPGGNATIRIRGATSINASNDPLYVIDGVPIENEAVTGSRNPLNFLNPSEIADVTVLKDASATAIYGSRGANGVIMITTKGGAVREGKASDKPIINYDGSSSVSTFSAETPILSAEEFRAAIAVFDDERVDNEAVIGPADTDWLDQVTQTAFSQQHNLSIGSNIQDGNYRFSTGYQQVNGVLNDTRTERYNVNFNISKGLLDNRLNLRFSTKNAVVNDKFGSNQVGAALSYNPTQPIYFDTSLYQNGPPAGMTGRFGGFTEYNDPLAVANPVAQSKHQKAVGESFRSINNFEVNYKLPFVPGLSIKNNIALDQKVTDNLSFSPNFIKSELRTQGQYSFERSSVQSFLYEGYLNYEKSIDAIDAKVTAVGGYSYQSWDKSFGFFRHDSLNTNAFGLDAPAPISNSNVVIGNNAFQNRLISFYGRFNFDWKDKYLVTGTLRRDGSTRFGPENRWALFPSFAAAWRISNEDFYEGLDRYVNYLKLRVGYGITGNQEIADYRYLTTYEFSTPTGSYQLGNQLINTLRPTAVDPDIKWEETTSINVGLDWEILKGKLAGAFEYYQQNTDDLIFEVAIPVGILPTDKVITNIGEMRNRGFEMDISSPIMTRRDFMWNVSFNAAYNNNEILRLDNTVAGAEETIYPRGGIAGDVGQTIQVLKVGESINSFYAYEQLYDANGDPIYEPINRTLMYKDQNNDSIINEKDLRVAKNANPDWIFGLTSVMNYKKIDFAFTFRANLGNYAYNNFSSNYGELRRLQTAVPQNIHTSALETGFEQKQILSDYYIENASFLRLDNVTIGYSIDRLDWMKARIYFTAQNVFVVTNYSGFDPEIQPSNPNDPPGIDNNLYPRARTFLGGISLTF
ncbi:SusC/RagA family TonB-linked outer membrane protein [Hyphobacterium sp. CCMP332]|nr:SusC/RagA family TonB-linked outer membrane protein [Hyphobacterium sp. CCMP332]